MTGEARAGRRRAVPLWRRYPDVFGVASLVGLVVAYLSPALVDGGSFGSFDLVIPLTSLGAGIYPAVPHNNLNSDVVSQMAAWNAFDWRAVHHLQFPLWNDLTLLGVPHFLNFESAVMSLPDLVSYLAPLRFAFLVAVAMKLLIAGTGTYVFCRIIGLRPIASSFGGGTYLLSGAFANWTTWPLSDVLSWIGWIAALVVLSYRHPGRIRYVVGLAASVAWCIYGGFPEANAFVIVSLSVIFAVAVAIGALRRGGVDLWGVARVVAGLLAGAAIAAPLWLPGLQVIHLAHRVTETGFPGDPARSLVLSVAPGYYGLPIKGSTWFLSGPNYYETVVYVGVICLVLALVAVVRWWNRPVVAGLALAAVVAVALSYQTKSFHLVQDLLNHHGLGQIEWLRMRTVLGFVLGVLAAIGLETLLATKGEPRTVITYVVVTAGALVATGLLVARALTEQLPQLEHQLRVDSLWWPVGCAVSCAVAAVMFVASSRPKREALRRSLVTAGALVLTGAQFGFLVFSGVGINSYSHHFYPVTPVIAELQHLVKGGLVGLDTNDPSQVQGFPPVGLFPNTNLGYDLAEYGGHDPLLPQSYFATWTTVPRAGRGGPGLFVPDINSATVARKYGIGWILQVEGSQIAPPAGAVLVATLAGERLYSVPGAARFSLVQPAHTAQSATGLAGPESAGRVTGVEHPVSSSWTLTTTSSAAAVLVMRVTDVPGWHATFDGRPLALSSYGGLMLQATVPAGRHTVHLWYLPGRLVDGLVLAFAAALALALAGVVSWRWRGRGSEISRRGRGRREGRSARQTRASLGFAMGTPIAEAARAAGGSLHARRKVPGRNENSDVPGQPQKRPGTGEGAGARPE